MTDLPAIAQLKRAQKWVAWKYVTRPGSSKPTKPPVNPHTGGNALVNKPDTWGSYDEAAERAHRDDLPGVGYVLTEDDGFTGIDLDDVRDPATGQLEPWAAEIIALAETYAEVSPSGTGIRMFCQGKIDQPIKKDNKGVEVYGKGRYLTITCNHVAGTPEEILPAPKTVAALRARVGKLEPEVPQHLRDVTPKGRGAADERPSKWQALSSEALANLDKWVPTLFGKGAIKTDDGRYRIPSKVLKRKLQEDISISPIGSDNPGIVDFGLHDMGDAREGKRTPLELVMEWSEACKDITDEAQKRKVAFNILSEWLGHDPALPTIRFYPDDVAAAVDELEAKLCDANVPIYVRAGGLVQPLWADLPNAKGGKVKSSHFKPFTYNNLAYMLTKHVATFEKYSHTQEEWVGFAPPQLVLNGLLELGHWKFPRVTGIINAPTLRPDGSIIDAKGYDAATELYYEPDNNIILPPIPLRPTKVQAQAALEKLKALLVEVPFVSELDRAVALAAILTAVARGGFSVAPMFLFLAHEAGSGKSYLVDLISAIIRGRDAPVIAGSAAKEEMEKRIGSLLLEGTPFISFDNLTGDLEGELLCQMCTQTTVRVRILGKSEAPECEWRGVLCATGNNVRLKGDMTRRGLICNLDPGVERPEQRSFKQDPIGAVAADRGAYLAAALTLVRGYLAAGKQVKCPPIGSYGGWSKFVREPLIWLGEADPVKSMDQARTDDPERAADTELIELWREHCGVNEAHKAAQVIEIATETESTGAVAVGAPSWKYARPEFQALLVAQACAPNRRDVDPKAFGKWLQRLQGKVIGGHRLVVVAKSKGHGNSWGLRAVNPG